MEVRWVSLILLVDQVPHFALAEEETSFEVLVQDQGDHYKVAVLEVQYSQMEVLHKDEEDLEDRVVLLLRRNLRVLEVQEVLVDQQVQIILEVE